tara:strand:+ start:150 stop:371 length:222 start_codon:yes stop_codon:yes gene_type:complete
VAVFDPLRAYRAEYGMFNGRRALAQDTLAAGDFDVIVIATDHDAVDYAGLLLWTARWLTPAMPWQSVACRWHV